MSTVHPFSVINGQRTPARPTPRTPKLTTKVVQARVTEKLRLLDGEQLQIVEIVIEAIRRGGVR